jgi:hypothetical protein
MNAKSRLLRRIIFGLSLALYLTLGVLLLSCLSNAEQRASSPVVCAVDIAHPGRAIPPDFCGLSYEIKMTIPHATSLIRYFRPENEPLINTFKTLGIKSLRVGGNTAERVTVPIPNEGDIDSLFAFARAADVKVIYTVRMEGNTAAAAAHVAKYVMDHYRDSVSCLTVGNEPDKPWKYPVYLEKWKQFTAAILAPDCAPDAKFCGPSVRHVSVEFTRRFANDMGRWAHLAYLTQHYYPGQDGDKLTDPAPARQLLLSPDLPQVYKKLYDAFVPAAKANGIGYRLEESNSYGRGGAAGASNTFTAALWSVDYLYWWAWHDALGINFHTGEKELRGVPGPNRPNLYTPLTSSADGIEVLPLGYGIKLFNLGSRGRLVPVNLSSNPDSLNVSIYGTLSPGSILRVTVLNKEYGSSARSAKLTINTGLPNAQARAIFMPAPAGDIASETGITIGGATIQEDGNWNGVWSHLPATGADGALTLTLPPATAAVIELQGK